MPTRLLIPITAFVLFASCAAPAEGSVKSRVAIYRNGAPVATIVTARKSPATVELAVAELQHHLKRMFGVELPRAADDEAVSGNVVLVGESARTSKLGLVNSRFARQEFLVETRSKALILIGRDRQVFGNLQYDNKLTARQKYGYVRHYNQGRQRFPIYPGWTKWDAVGTCYAVYDFLERFCDVRWYMPGENGTYIPTGKNLSLGHIRIQRKPWMVYREGTGYEKLVPRRLYWWNRNEKPTTDDILPWRDTQLWILRNKGWGDPFIANHSYVQWHRRFSDKHPDWFVAEPHPAWKRLGWELCLSHPGVRRQMLKDAGDYFEGRKVPWVTAAGDYFSITPNDHSTKKDFCHCEKCRPLLGYPDTRESLSEQDREFSYGSRLFWSFIADIAGQIKKTHPNKYISALAYPFFLHPPPGMKKIDNLAVMVTLQPSGAFQYCPPFKMSREQLLQKWAKPAGQVFVWLYTIYPQYLTGERFPELTYYEFSRQMKFFHRNGVKGFFDNMDSGVKLKVDELGGRKVSVWPNPMEDFFRCYILLKMADDITVDAGQLYDEFYRNWYGRSAKHIRDFVHDAQRLHHKPDFVFNGTLQPQGYRPERSVGKGWQEAVWGGVCGEDDLKRLGGYISKAYKAADTPSHRAHVELFDKAIYRGIVSGRAKWIPPAQRKGLRKRVVCPRLPDGVSVTPTNVPWKNAAELSPFVPHRYLPIIGPNFDSRAKLRHPTTIRVIRDQSKIYFRIHCFGEELKKDDSREDDVVELFFSPDDTGEFYQILVYADGSVKDYSSKEKWNWRSNAEAVVVRQANAWIANVAIPLRSVSDVALRSALPDAGDMWRFNVTRSLRNWTVLSAWSPASGSWRNPDYFGELWFSVLKPNRISEKVEWAPMKIPDPGWNKGRGTWNAPEARASFRLDTAVKRSGPHSYHISNESDAPTAALYLARVRHIGQNKAIRAGAWVKTQNALVEIRIRFRDKKGVYAGQPIKGEKLEGTTEWTRIQVQSAIPLNAEAVDIFLICRKGKAWFADLVCEKTGT